MPLYSLIVKRSCNGANGVKIEKGMNIEVVMQNSNLAGFISTSQGKTCIQETFLKKYHIDLKKGCHLQSGNFEVKLIS